MSKSSVTKSRKCQERGEKGFKPVLGEALQVLFVGVYMLSVVSGEQGPECLIN